MTIFSKINENTSIDEDVLKQFPGGFSKCNLKNKLQISNNENDTELTNFVHSSYIDTEKIGALLK